jgi:hypothetical protein
VQPLTPPAPPISPTSNPTFGFPTATLRFNLMVIGVATSFFVGQPVALQQARLDIAYALTTNTEASWQRQLKW